MVFFILTFFEYFIKYSFTFTIIRNNEYTRTLYKISQDIQRVLTEKKYIAFDEAGKKIKLCRKLIPAYDLINIDNFVCWTSIVQKEANEGNLKLYSRYLIKESLPFSTILTYNNGEINIKSDYDEFAIYHLVTEKRNLSFVIPKWKIIDDKFYITTTGFYKYNEYHNFYFLLRNYRNFLGFFKKIRKKTNDSFNYRFKNKN